MGKALLYIRCKVLPFHKLGKIIDEGRLLPFTDVLPQENLRINMLFQEALIKTCSEEHKRLEKYIVVYLLRYLKESRSNARNQRV